MNAQALAERAVQEFLAGDAVARDLAIGRSCAIEYVAPAFPGETVVASAVERARQGRTRIYDVGVRRASDGALLAELRAVSRELRAAPGVAPRDPDDLESSPAPR